MKYLKKKYPRVKPEIALAYEKAEKTAMQEAWLENPGASSPEQAYAMEKARMEDQNKAIQNKGDNFNVKMDPEKPHQPVSFKNLEEGKKWLYSKIEKGNELSYVDMTQIEYAFQNNPELLKHFAANIGGYPGRCLEAFECLER